jgi:hypothetical protein
LGKSAVVATAVIVRGKPTIDGYGDGYGYGYGYGYGDGDGNGYGDGDGNGNGYGYSNGNGDGYGYGYGDGYGYGYGYGYGDGDGNGYGDGDGNGYGYGYSNGNGNGNGNGDGNGENSFTYWAASIETILANADAKRVSLLRKAKVIFAYWRSTENGEPANGGKGTKAKVGLVEEIKGPLQICTANALHGTLNPPKWRGSKIWVVALYPPYVQQEDKIGSLKREIVCEAGFKLD